MSQQPIQKQPILIVGDDVEWLGGRTELAGRNVMRAANSQGGLVLVAAKTFDCVLASFRKSSDGVAFLDAATAAQPALCCAIRAVPAASWESAPRYSIVPLSASVDVLRTRCGR